MSRRRYGVNRKKLGSARTRVNDFDNVERATQYLIEIRTSLCLN